MKQESVCDMKPLGFISLLLVLSWGSGGCRIECPGPDLWPIRIDGRWGYIDRTGKIRIAARYATHDVFSEGLAPFKKSKGGKWGYMNTLGMTVVEPQYEKADAFSEGLAAVGTKVLQSGKIQFGYIDRTGRIVIRPKYSKAGKFSEGLAAVKTPPDQIGYITRTGEYAIAPRNAYTVLDVGTLPEFSEGLVEFKVGKVWGYMNKAGKAVLKPEYRYACPFRRGLAYVTCVSGKHGFIDPSGQYVIEPKFAYIKPYWSDDGRIGVCRDVANMWGYFDRSGKYVIEPRFTGATAFREGLAAVAIGKGPDYKCGYVDEEGAFVIEPRFAIAGPFAAGLAIVTTLKDHRAGVIDRTGKFVIPPKFRYLEESNGIYRVITDQDEIGYLDASGAYIWKPTK